MKVLKEKDIKSWAIQCDCFSCESTLEVTAEDIFIFNDPDPRQQSSIFYKASCAVCKTEFWVDKDKIPTYVQNYICRSK